MSEPTDVLPTISFDEAVRFFKTVTPSGKCPFCGSDEYVIHMSRPDLVDDVVQGMHILSKPIDGRLIGKIGVSIVTTECSTCGFLRRHGANRIKSWIDDNPKKEEIQDGDGDKQKEGS